MKTKRGSSPRRILIEGGKCRRAGVYSHRINHRSTGGRQLKLKTVRARGRFTSAKTVDCADLVKPNIIKHKNIPRRYEENPNPALPERGKVNKKCSLLQWALINARSLSRSFPPSLSPSPARDDCSRTAHFLNFNLQRLKAHPRAFVTSLP